ncbi:ParB N-terminal domain-containing protein [Promicromonospora iranensis]|uniref:ParB family chromosome partitioning protein n=1 Tax=Promicromonospora iranensis TaxID=1105144 RepID=A0ABU2CIQ3_9MICO|nr:ParB N-terminal domain-containing protein [Promicromonospora iranensis]MDR7381222.1 ParB family chromosome partitioning protein [Promicromonospora iranensis]
MSVQIENKNVEKRAGNSPEVKVEFGLLDPRTLLVETNVRTEANLTPRFLKSIRDNGVLIAILVQRTEQGLRVRAGQRRTLAAIEEGLETIPAMIVQGDEDQVRRIREQMAENDDRQGLRHADRVAAFEQMSLLGVSAVDIANTTGHSTSDVQAALTVAKTKKAKAVQAKYDLTLDQAAVLAEFENDTEAVKALTEIAIKSPDRFAHAAQQRRDDRDAAARLAKAVKALADAGIKQVTNWNTEVKDNRAAQELDKLQTGEGKTLTPEGHAICPQRAAYISTSWNGDIHTRHVCLDYKAAGHKLNRTNVNDTRTEQEKQAASAERAEVITNNKAWKSAETVRREWLAQFAKRKSAPKDAANFIAGSFTADTHSIEKAGSGAHALACEWLGLKTTGGWGSRQALNDLIAKATPARALHIALVLALAAIEERTGLHTWRRPGTESRYLRALEVWGYNLSDVEQIARGPQETPACPAAKQTTPKTAPTTNPAPAAPATKSGAQPKADNPAPVTNPAKVASPGKAATPNKGQAKPQVPTTTDNNAVKALEKPVLNPTRATTPDAGAATEEGAGKRQPVVPKDQKQARSAQPAAAGSR